MRNRDKKQGRRLTTALKAFSAKKRLVGLEEAESRESLVEQLVESIRRLQYISVIRDRDISKRRSDPRSTLFDPVKAAIWHQRQGNRDEAFWQIFIFAHFGKHGRTSYQLARDVYGGLGKVRWTWKRICADPREFRGWLASNQQAIRDRGGIFGNHRKYTSLDAYKVAGTGEAFTSYIAWVGDKHSHDALLQAAGNATDGDPKGMFKWLYRSMANVRSFGRTGRFDYLTMLGKTGLAPIEPGTPCLSGATGPLAGARLLFDGDRDSTTAPRELDEDLILLGETLGVGMQVLEDALCNWQKSPTEFVPFRG